MLKKYEVEEIIKNALFELDGVVSDKTNEDGSYDIYFADVIEDPDGMTLTFQTNFVENAEIDKYRITVDYAE